MTRINFLAFATLLLPALSLAKTVSFGASVGANISLSQHFPANYSQYDDEFTLPANGALTPVGTYKGLTYNNFIVASDATLNESAAGCIPHSDPNVALQRSPSGSITTGPGTKSFSLSSVYYGCDLADQNGVVSTAVACTITVTGYKAGSSSPYTSQVFKFTPQQAVDVMNPLTFGTFSSKFTGLHNVTVAAKASSSIFTVVGIIDNLAGSTSS